MVYVINYVSKEDYLRAPFETRRDEKNFTIYLNAPIPQKVKKLAELPISSLVETDDAEWNVERKGSQVIFTPKSNLRF